MASRAAVIDDKHCEGVAGVLAGASKRMKARKVLQLRAFSTFSVIASSATVKSLICGVPLRPFYPDRHSCETNPVI